MKNILSLSFIALCVVLATSCDSGFDEMNTSDIRVTTIDPGFILNNAIINSSPGGVNPGIATSNLTYDIAIVQQIITSNGGVQVGGNFNQVNIGNTPLTWNNYYQNVVRYTDDVITRTKDDATRANLYHMARIIHYNALMILTDTYGNIPFAEAGQGYTDQNFFPAYEDQETIYPKIIEELKSATDSLNASRLIESSDVLYSGNIAMWKKFGYSILLRAGMRLSEVNPQLAEATAAFAFSRGVIVANADNAIIRHDANFQNGIGNIVNGTEAANFYLAKPFVQALKTTNDPRLSAIAVRYKGAKSGATQIADSATTAPANQYGMPIGSDDSHAQDSALVAGIGSRYAFSQADRNRILKRTSPSFIVTAAQTNLLLAEAAARGWIPGGDAATYFTAGIKAHMDQMASYDAAAAVSATARDNYATANPLDVSTLNASIQQISYQYWIACFLHGSEAWANFRRTGYPALKVNPFEGKTVDFINRITYPPSEILVNGEHVNDAIAAMGGNNLDTRVWWDLP